MGLPHRRINAMVAYQLRPIFGEIGPQIPLTGMSRQAYRAD
jgi:hypothetical protein